MAKSGSEQHGWVGMVTLTLSPLLFEGSCEGSGVKGRHPDSPGSLLCIKILPLFVPVLSSVLINVDSEEVTHSHGYHG